MHVTNVMPTRPHHTTTPPHTTPYHPIYTLLDLLCPDQILFRVPCFLALTSYFLWNVSNDCRLCQTAWERKENKRSNSKQRPIQKVTLLLLSRLLLSLSLLLLLLLLSIGPSRHPNSYDCISFSFVFHLVISFQDFRHGSDTITSILFGLFKIWSSKILFSKLLEPWR